MSGMRAVYAGIAIGLVLAACGGGSPTSGGSPDQTSPEATPSVSTPAETTHAAKPGEPALITVPGYSYENDPGMATLVRQRMNQLEGYKGFSLHGVTEDDDRVGTLVLLQATPALDQAVKSGAIDPTQPPPGSSASRSTIAGERVLTVDDAGEAGPGSTLWIWYHDGTLSQFFQSNGASQEQAMDFVEAYLREANRK